MRIECRCQPVVTKLETGSGPQWDVSIVVVYEDVEGVDDTRESRWIRWPGCCFESEAQAEAFAERIAPDIRACASEDDVLDVLTRVAAR